MLTRQLRDGNAAVFMVGGRDRETVPEWVAGTRVQVASMSGLFRKERTATDPEFCERFEGLLVTASNCAFLPPFNAETILSRRIRLDLCHDRGIHERRSMDPDESVWLQFFCRDRELLAQQIGIRFPLQ